MDFENILGKALRIAKDKKFIVYFYNELGNKHIETKEMTYLQLGTYLITNSDGIMNIKIFSKE